MNSATHTSDLESLFQERYPEYRTLRSSVRHEGPLFLALVKKEEKKELLLGAHSASDFPENFKGTELDAGKAVFKLCPMDHVHATALRSLLPYTRPVTLGNANSFGFGDRLGNAGPAHLRSLGEGKPFFMPILAQQSIRELDRTRRTAEEVMDAATWAVFQEGYTAGFGSDADHLKTTGDIDRMIKAGFTFFTIDPSDYVDNRSMDMDLNALKKAFTELPWDELGDQPAWFSDRYVNKTFRLENNITIQPSEEDILRAAVKYGRVILHTLKMYRYLREKYEDRDTEVELSVDETPFPTTPEEHLIIASELHRLQVRLVSLAPRFCGDFEKGVDFKGDLDSFRKEYLLHQAIASAYGQYKLSIHSGSDKFQVYEAIGQLGQGFVHVKTAGTSYLEALRALSMTDPELFREIITFSKARFESDKKTYHISAELSKMGDAGDFKDDELPALLDDDNARQIFHVTFGSVLTDSESAFKDRIMQTLTVHESVYEDCLYKHFRKHILPFEKAANE